MVEAYFEERNAVIDWLQYPFECFIADSSEWEVEIPHHWHYYIEVLYMTNGEADVYLEDGMHHIVTGDMVIISSREIHAINAKKECDTKYIVIKFDLEVLYTTHKSVFESKYVLPFIRESHSHQRVFKKEEIEMTQLGEWIATIHQEAVEKSHGFELAVRTGIGSVFLWILRDWEKKGIKLELESQPNEGDIKVLQKVVNYLDKNFAQEISVTEMAKLSSMSYSYFSRFFKKNMHKTFVEYLNFVRVTEAEKLLMTTDLNVTEIGLSTGFANSSYFIKQFKKIKMISPKQYRKNMVKSDNMAQ